MGYRELIMYIQLLLTLVTLMDVLATIYAFIHLRKSLGNILKPEYNTLAYDALNDSFISVIIPVRNGAKTLPKTIESVLSQDRDQIEVIIVDDESIDETPLVAKKYETLDSRVKCLRIKEKPCNWGPKAYACYIGYRNSRGKYLVFLDSDTWFIRPWALSLLVHYLKERNGIVSLLPRFLCSTLRCKIVEIVLTVFSHAFFGFDRVLRKRSRRAWFYGCCWAISRETYNRLGTHKVVWNSIVEDRDLAEKAKNVNIPITIVNGRDLVATLWYPLLRDTVNVLARVLRRYGRKRLESLLASIIILLAYWIPIISIIYGIVSQHILIGLLGLIGYAILSFLHMEGAEINKYSKFVALLHPIGGAVLAIGLCKATLAKNISWKGRIVEEPLYKALREHIS